MSRTNRETRRRLGTHRPGPRLAITTEGHTRLLQALRGGVPITYAAEVAGIGTRTLHRYLQRGEDADIRHEDGETLDDEDEWMRQIWLDVQRARAESATRGVALIQRVAQGGTVVKETTRTFRGPDGKLVTEVEKTFTPPDARPVQWLLERTHRPEFGKTSALELTGANGGQVQVEAGAAGAIADRLAEIVAARRAELEMRPDGDDEVVVEATAEDLG